MRNVIYGLVCVLVINFIGMYYDFYNFYWFDIVLHLSGGFFVAMLFSKYLEHHLLPDHKITNMLIIIGSAVFIGVIWEFAEYSANNIIRPPLQAAYDYYRVPDFQGDLDDTMKDLLMDTLGALTMAGLFLRLKRK